MLSNFNRKNIGNFQVLTKRIFIRRRPYIRLLLLLLLRALSPKWRGADLRLR